MLPFLKPQKAATTVMASTKPEGGIEDKEENHGMMSAAEDLIRAVHAKDAQGVCDALSAAMDMRGSKEDFLSSEG